MRHAVPDDPPEAENKKDGGGEASQNDHGFCGLPANKDRGPVSKIEARSYHGKKDNIIREVLEVVEEAPIRGEQEF